MYKLLIRPFLFKFLPETAHNLTLRALGLLSRIPLATAVLRCIYDCKTTCLEQELFGLRFPHPVGLAAGLDKNGEYYNELSCFGFSFIEIGSPDPQAPIRQSQASSLQAPQDKAIINRMGINNKGIRHAIDNLNEDPPGMILVASIAKNSSSSSDEEIQKDYETAFSLLYDFVDMFTLNISCPNVEGVQSLQDVSFLSDIVDPLLDLRLCYDVYKPVLVKVSPDLPFEQLDEILDYCMLSGIDGIVAGNTTTSRDGLSASPELIREIGPGGLSGAPLFRKTLEQVKHIHIHTKGRLPIVGCGGIQTPEQAQEMLDAGASLLEIYTGFIYEGPALVRKIVKFLDNRKKNEHSKTEST